MLTIFFFSTTSMRAQEGNNCCKHFHGFDFGFPAFNQKLNGGYPYRPFLLLYHQSLPLNPKNDRDLFSFYFEPQFNPVLFKQMVRIEFGINGGLMYTRTLDASWQLYLMIGSGPHYINAMTQRQASGFIFSDNLAAGVRKKMRTGDGDTAINIQFRLRHISNAGLKEPNGGINNAFLVVGWIKELGSGE